MFGIVANTHLGEVLRRRLGLTQFNLFEVVYARQSEDWVPDPLECHADVEVETSRARIVEVVVTDIRQADVIAQTEVEHVEARATSDAQTAIEALEGGVVITEARISLAGAIVLDLSTDTEGEVATGKRLNLDIRTDCILIFEHEWQFEIVEPVGELVALIRAFATFLRVGETRFKIEWGSGGESGANDSTDIETCARITAVEDSGIGVHGGYVQAETEAIVCILTEVIMRWPIIIGVAIAMARRNGSAVRIILC